MRSVSAFDSQPPSEAQWIITRIFHVANGDYLREATDTGLYRGSTLDRSLEDEGFIHCSRRDQLQTMVNRWYRDAEHIIVLIIDRERVVSPVIDEPGSDGQTYPHIYGPLNTDAVIGTRRIARTVEGYNLDPL